MASLTQKIVNGHKYYYARECKRVDGKPKIVRTIYLGNVDTMINNSKASKTLPDADEVCILELGATAALYDIAQQLDFVGIVDRHAQKKKQGPSVGQYMLVAAINRAACPTSKSALAEWFEQTVGPRLLGIAPKQLSSQAFWNHMDRLDPKTLVKIENDLFAKLIEEFDIDLNCLLYDATNFYTYINTKTTGEIARRGHNKQKRNDLRQISLGMMTTADFHIPLLHMVYGGNITDAPQFKSVIDELVNRYKRLTEACPHITLVFDKGNNSEDNINSLPDTQMHFVGSLKLNQCKEQLLKMPLSKYRQMEGEKLKDVMAYRCQQVVFGQDRTVLLTYNENLVAGQLQGIGANTAKCRAELQELQDRLRKRANGKISKGKKPTIEGTRKKVSGICRREYMSRIIKTNVFIKDGFVRLTYHIDQNALTKLMNTVLGKNVLFTDNKDWTDEQIILAYRAQYSIEHAFREMKNPHYLGWDPRYHWTDQKIRVHAFYCVFALTLVSLIRKQLDSNGLSISAESLMKNLNQIRETVSIYVQSKKKNPRLSYSISSMNKTQKQLYKMLDLEQYRQN